MQCANQNVGIPLHYDKLVASVKEQKGTKGSIYIAFKNRHVKITKFFLSCSPPPKNISHRLEKSVLGTMITELVSARKYNRHIQRTAK